MNYYWLYVMYTKDRALSTVSLAFKKLGASIFVYKIDYIYHENAYCRTLLYIR